MEDKLLWAESWIEGMPNHKLNRNVRESKMLDPHLIAAQWYLAELDLEVSQISTSRKAKAEFDRIFV